jgi:hypothetical protein
MKFECLSGNIGNGFTIHSLQTLGLAYKAQTCTGFGVNMTVQTIDRCSYGNLGDLDAKIKAEFDSKCVGKTECEIDFNYQTMFNSKCI